MAAPLQTTTYYLTVTDALGCHATDSVTVTTCIDKTTGIGAINNISPYLEIFPNPANDVLNITSAITQIQEISIIDLTGQQVLHQSMLTGSNFDLDITSLSAGAYIIDIATATQRYHSRFVKVNAK